MPKTRSKKTVKMKNAQSRATRLPQNTGARTGSAHIAASAPSVVTNRRRASPGGAGPQSLILPSMVALGSWGMAFSFVYFYNDPNRLLFAGMAALMALLWSYSVFVRIRKMRAMRQKSM
jgi:hypothetical protein